MPKKTKETAIYWACYSECIIYHSKPKFCVSSKTPTQSKYIAISKKEIHNKVLLVRKKYAGRLAFNQSKRKRKYKAIILAVLNDKLKAKMYQLGISALEKYVPISEIQAKKHATEIKRHYVYTDFSTYEWSIIDCPILRKIQADSNKSGYQISMLNVDKYNINESKKVFRRK